MTSAGDQPVPADAKDSAMAGLVSELHGIVCDVTNESRQELQQVRDLMSQSIATLDGSFTAIAKGAEQQKQLVSSLLIQLNSDDEALAETASRLESNNGAIHEHVAAAIRSLQFEDLLRQIMEHLDERLSALDKTTAQLADQAESLHATAPNDYARQLYELQLQLSSARAQLRTTDHRAVTQSSMDEGEIDLF
jgi:methyl-accepting chemotaxis protein